jgi:hypothetical protein
MRTPAHYHPQIFGATSERMTPQPNPAEPPCRIPRPPTGSTCEPLEAGLYPGGFMLVYDNKRTPFGILEWRAAYSVAPMEPEPRPPPLEVPEPEPEPEPVLSPKPNVPAP